MRGMMSYAWEQLHWLKSHQIRRLMRQYARMPTNRTIVATPVTTLMVTNCQ